MATVFATTITVSSAGTAVQVSSTPRPFVWAWFHNAPGNSGNVYIGGSDVSSTNGLSLQRLTGSANHLDEIKFEGKLFAEDPPLDLMDFYVDAASSGDTVEILAKVL